MWYDVARARLRHVFYGWWIVVAGFLVQGLNGGLLLNAFTVYFVPLQAEFGWSRTALAGAFSLTRTESGLLGPLEGWAIDRWGPRPVVLVGAIFFGLGFVLFSLVHSLLAYYAVFTLIALGSSLAGFTATAAAVANWFLRKRSRAMGIAMAGMGVGGLLVPLVAVSITTYGWRPTAVGAGVVIWLIGIPSALMLRRSPESCGMLPDGEQAAGSFKGQGTSPALHGHTTRTSGGPEDFSARQALRTSTFWLLAWGHASALLVVGALMVHQVPHMVQRLDLSLEAAGLVVAALTFMQVVGQLLGGYFGDLFSKRLLLVATMGGHATGLLLLAYATSWVHLALFTILHGLAWGVRAPLLQSLRADYFGRSAFATILGFNHLVTMAGMMTAPIFAGWLADIQDSYQLAFTILAIMAALGSLFFLFARKPRLPHGREVRPAQAAPSR